MTSKAAKSAGSAKSAPKSPSERAAQRARNLIPGAGRGPAKGAPNAGRPPSAIRETLRKSFDERIAILQRIADDPESSPSDAMKAVEMMGKYGMGTTTAVVDSDGNDVQSPVVLLPAVAK